MRELQLTVGLVLQSDPVGNTVISCPCSGCRALSGCRPALGAALLQSKGNAEKGTGYSVPGGKFAKVNNRLKPWRKK